MRRKNWPIRVLALGMSTVMICTTPVFAQEIQTPDQTQEQENTVIVNKDASGSCGPNLTWTLDKTNGVLLISGSGNMDDYYYDYYEDDEEAADWAPWSGYREIKKVVIASGVTNIGENSFGGCKNLEQVEISDTVTEIGSGAFTDCDSLKEVTIPKNVTKIGEEAFYRCDKLKKVTVLGDADVAKEEFASCKKLEQVEFKGNVSVIGEKAFSECDNLTRIEIPASVERVETGAFDGSSLKTIVVDESNAAYKSIDGSLYSKDGSILVRGSEKEKVELSQDVQKIGAYAFSECEKLNEVTIPDGVTEIGDYAFRIWKSSAKVSIPKSVTKISPTAFDNFSGIIFGKKDSYAQEYALKYNIAFCEGSFEESEKTPAIIKCKNTVTLTADASNYKLAELMYGTGKLQYESSNTKVVNTKGKIVGPGIATVKVSVKSSGAYGGCTEKMTVKVGPVKQKASAKKTGTNMTVSWNKDKQASGYQIQYSTDKNFQKSVKKIEVGKNSVTSKTVANLSADKKYYARVRSYITTKVSGKKEKVYGYWSNQTEAEVQKSGKAGVNAKWSYDEASKTLTISGKGDMYEDDFTYSPYKKKVETIQIKSGVTGIGSYAFWGFSNLKKVSLPSGLKSIGRHTFHHCSSLETIDLPDSVTRIGEWAFCGCDQLKEVILPAGVEELEEYTFYDCKRLKKVTMQQGIKNVGYGVFEDCKNLEEVYGSSSIEQIGEEAFYKCYNLHTVDGFSNVKRIGRTAFFGCTKLKNISSFAALEEIGEMAFKNCSSLLEVEILDGEAKIGNSAFYNCSSLKKVTIGAKNADIQDEAFYNCDKLEELQISEHLKTIGKKAFFGCESLKNLNLPKGVKQLEDGAFSRCSGIEDVTISGETKKIGGRAFADCTSLKHVSLPAEVNNIGWMAFENCEKLETISVDEANQKFCSVDGNLYNKEKTKLIRAGIKMTELEPQVTEIGDGALENLKDVKRLILPEGLKRIGYVAFRNSSSLLEIEIPNSVTEIAKEAFRGCTSLEKIGIDDGNRAYCSKDGSLYSQDGKTLIRASAKENIEIAKGVTSIEGAFDECSHLKTLKIPASLTMIKAGEFAKCSQLTTITVDEGNTMYTSIDGSLYNKGGRILLRAAAKESITLPKTVTAIASTAFVSCFDLDQILVEEGNKCYKSVDGSLYTKDGKRLIQVSAKEKSFEVPAIAFDVSDYAFSNCKDLTEIAFHKESNYEGSYSKQWTIYCEERADVLIDIEKGITVKPLNEFPGELKTFMPDVVTGVKKTDVKNNQIAITWKKQTGVSGYRVSYYDATTRKQKEVELTGEKKNTVVLKKLKADTTYTIYVCAFHKTEYGTLYGNKSKSLEVKTKK